VSGISYPIGRTMGEDPRTTSALAAPSEYVQPATRTALTASAPRREICSGEVEVTTHGTRYAGAPICSSSDREKGLVNAHSLLAGLDAHPAGRQVKAEAVDEVLERL
jgi:hypothetical protein